MMTTLEYDDGATQRLLAIYVTPDVAVQRNDFLHAFNPQPGQRVLDVGSGPGFLTNAIAKVVGKSGSVCGVDISDPMLEIAQSQGENRYSTEFRQGDATQLPYSDEDFDVVVSSQVLEYVPDVDDALAEFHRVLRAGGRVALLDTDWDSIVWYSPDQALMSRILAAWEEHAADPFLPRTLAQRLRRAGFQVMTQKIFPLYNTEFDPNTYSNRLIDLIIPFVVGRRDITRDEAETWALQLRDCGKNGEYFFSLNRYFFLARKL